MMTMSLRALSGALLLSLGAASSQAAVSQAEAARLGQELTPVGAEKSGAGDIPAWTGGLQQPPAGYEPGGKLVDPFADEKPLFVITAENYQQYADNLSEGQKALFEKYPDTYRMPVYPTHRTAAYPQEIYDATAANATRTELVDGGNGLKNYVVGTPFPIPQNGLEAIWNHIVRYRGGSVERVIGQVTPQANGDYTLVQFGEEFTFREELSDYKPGQDDNVLFYFKQEVLSPARLAGNVLLVYETLDQVKEPRKAWIYNAGSRKVRRAPTIAYDSPGTASDGMRTSDNFDLYNGAPDRYEWKLVGKQEMYIPYNAYKLESKDLGYDDIVKAGHINQDHARYELHRVWKVEATLKDGMRHIYAKRTFYLDEDTWQAGIIDHYDGRGVLWRVAEGHEVSYYQDNVPWTGLEVLYDLTSGRYLALGLDNEEPGTYQFGIDRSSRDYSTSALRRSGRR